MSGKAEEYLEKFAVAPAPSRDYYGLKVLRDEVPTVILYLWRISHGPHKLPIIRTVKFADFQKDKAFQDEIRCIFGEYLLKHLRNVTQGHKSLLTLPKTLIQRIAGYLNPSDIVNLSLLSHAANEVFNEDLIWKIAFKNSKRAKVLKDEKPYMVAHGWKELFKDQQMEFSAKDQKISRTRSAIKQEPVLSQQESKTLNNVKLKANSFASSSANVGLKKPLELWKKNLSVDSSTKKSFDSRFNGLNKVSDDHKKSIPAKKNLSNKTVKNERKTVKIANESKSTLKTTELKWNSLNKTPDVLKNGANKKQAEIKNKTLELKKFVDVKNSKVQKDIQSIKSRNQEVQKRIKKSAKNVAQSKSMILKMDKSLVTDVSVIKGDNFSLTDLIEPSAKNTRSPRNTFDYDFSRLNDFESRVGDSKGNETVGRKSEKKSTATTVGEKLNKKLSEKSETGKEEIIDSATDEDEDDMSYFSAKHSKAWMGKIMDSLKDTESSALRSQSEKPKMYSVFENYARPREVDAVMDSKSFSAKIASDGRSDRPQPINIFSKLSGSKSVETMGNWKDSVVKRSLDGLSMTRKTAASGLDSVNPLPKFSTLKKIDEVVDTKDSGETMSREFQLTRKSQLDKSETSNFDQLFKDIDEDGQNPFSRILTNKKFTGKDQINTHESLEKPLTSKRINENRVKTPISTGTLGNINALKSLGSISLAARTVISRKCD